MLSLVERSRSIRASLHYVTAKPEVVEFSKNQHKKPSSRACAGNIEQTFSLKGFEKKNRVFVIQKRSQGDHAVSKGRTIAISLPVCTHDGPLHTFTKAELQTILQTLGSKAKEQNDDNLACRHLENEEQESSQHFETVAHLQISRMCTIPTFNFPVECGIQDEVLEELSEVRIPTLRELFPQVIVCRQAKEFHFLQKIL